MHPIFKSFSFSLFFLFSQKIMFLNITLMIVISVLNNISNGNLMVFTLANGITFLLPITAFL